MVQLLLRFIWQLKRGEHVALQARTVSTRSEADRLAVHGGSFLRSPVLLFLSNSRYLQQQNVLHRQIRLLKTVQDAVTICCANVSGRAGNSSAEAVS